MSLILKGIYLPPTLYTDIRIYWDGRIKRIIGENTMVSYNKNVQVIQIPKDHGRLIDADKLRKGFSRTESGYCGYWEFCDKPEDMQFLIDDEPTILDKERE